VLNTSKARDMSSMFSNCTNLTTIPELDTSSATNMRHMFSGCKKLTSLPDKLNTSKIYDMYYMFYGCENLTTIPALDVSKVNSMSETFKNCFNLKSILMYGMKVSFNISVSTQFEASDLVTILNNLATVTSTQTLTMGATNLAKLTDEQKAIATNKGWTLAYGGKI
jgi:surface protein